MPLDAARSARRNWLGVRALGLREEKDNKHGIVFDPLRC